MKTYRAPWCRLLWILSATALIVCLLCGLLPWLLPGMEKGPFWTRVLMFLPVVLVPACALFVVRSYRVTGDAIRIRRLFWETRLTRVGLRSARHEPDSMRKSVRLCGNGGFFSFTGWYWSPSLKTYRAFVTDPKRAVVLRYATRTVVVSPDDPEAFVAEVSSDGAPEIK